MSSTLAAFLPPFLWDMDKNGMMTWNINININIYIYKYNIYIYK